jgi:hypothetical protein
VPYFFLSGILTERDGSQVVFAGQRGLSGFLMADSIYHS